MSINMKRSNMKEKFEISVVIPAYNREKTIKRCIDSAMRQTYAASEIIVVDDGSTDKTLNIIEKEYNGAVRVIKQKHKGAQAARNAGIRIAQGEYIAFLDSDDEWLLDKLEAQIKTYLDRMANRVDFYASLRGLSPSEVEGYLESFTITPDALVELKVRACNMKTGCFRLLDRTLSNVRRILNERGEATITVKIIEQASSMMML